MQPAVVPGLLFEKMVEGCGIGDGVAVAGRPSSLFVAVPLLVLHVRLFDPLQGWQAANRFSSLFLRDAQIIKTLQVEPELGACAEEMRESQSAIARNSAPAIQYLGDAVGRNVKPPCQYRDFACDLTMTASPQRHRGSPDRQQMESH